MNISILVLVISAIGTLFAIGVIITSAIWFILNNKPSKKATILTSVITTVFIAIIIIVAVVISNLISTATGVKSPIQILPTSKLTTTPATNIPSPSPIPTPNVISKDLTIPCLTCGGGYGSLIAVLNTITIDYSNKLTAIKFTITNPESSTCNQLYFRKLEFQDESGTIFTSRSEGENIADSLAPGSPFITNAIFDLLPQHGIHYLLFVNVGCRPGGFDFKTQDFILD